MIRKKRNISFLNDTTTSSKSIEEPMLTKEEQKTMKTKRVKKVNSLYNSENISSFTPKDNFVYFKSIKNHEIPIYVTGHEEQDKEEEVRCDYCGKIHLREKSIFIPDQMYDEEEDGLKRRVYQGKGNFDCFECGYGFILQQIPYGSHTTPYIYNNSKYYYENMFQKAYPGEKLYPAPKFENMGMKWNGKYTFVKLIGCEFRKNISYYQIRKEEEKEIKEAKEEAKEEEEEEKGEEK